LNFPFYIAKRYLFSKTGNNAINIITIIASFGVIVGAAALFVILSGFSGLRTFSYSLLEASDPDIKITASKGKSFKVTDAVLHTLNTYPDIIEYSGVIEERVFLTYKNKNEIAFVKGVDANYNSVTKIDSAIVVGEWLSTDYYNTAVVGRTIASKLSLGVNNFTTPLEIMIPKPGKGFINPNNAFYSQNVQVVGLYSGTEEFESKYVYVDIDVARQLLKYKDDMLSAFELRIANPKKANELAENLQNTLGDAFTVQTKEQLNEVFYKVINTENFVSYLIFTLIVIIALFNVIGAIIMMIIDKRDNLKTLLNLGTSVKQIKQIFVFQGFLLTVVGMIIGLFLATVAVFLQKKYGFLMITQNLPYPVEFRISNLIIVILTITTLGYIASKIASSRINRAFIEK